VIVRLRLKETFRPTMSVEARAQAFSVGRVVGGYWRLLRDKRFLGYVLCSALPMSAMFIYISGAPFVMIELFHVPVEHFGWVFGANAVLLIVGSQVNGFLVGKVEPGVLLRRAIQIQSVAGILLLLHGLTGWGGLYGLLAPLGLFTFFLGFIPPNAMVLAMAPFGPIAGMASALMGTVQFVTGAAAATMMSAIHTHTALPMTGGMALSAASSLAVHTFFVRKLPPVQENQT
jgi:DHA1 family bicyclomycin/chloramphenicol resistance-like MFS transporter